MNWKQYQNELIVLSAFLLMLGAYMYKHSQATTQAQNIQATKHSVEELKEVIALKKVWAGKETTKKVAQLEKLMPASKVKWSNKSKKVTANYTALSANELNKLITKILNLPVVIRLLDVKKIGANYNVEFKCKW